MSVNPNLVSCPCCEDYGIRPGEPRCYACLRDCEYLYECRDRKREEELDSMEEEYAHEAREAMDR